MRLKGTDPNQRQLRARAAKVGQTRTVIARNVVARGKSELAVCHFKADLSTIASTISQGRDDAFNQLKTPIAHGGLEERMLSSFPMLAETSQHKKGSCKHWRKDSPKSLPCRERQHQKNGDSDDPMEDKESDANRLTRDIVDNRISPWIDHGRAIISPAP